LVPRSPICLWQKRSELEHLAVFFIFQNKSSVLNYIYFADMKELSSAYNSTETEPKIYQAWLDSGYFNPDNLPDQKAPTYTIIMPPPNANAPLHVGHALGFTIQDILIRFHRMRGFRTLWQPGMDHAGFETQVVFEKKLEKEDRSRFQMQRDDFYKEIWDFVQANKHISEEGIKRLGASCDWSRNIFTLDPKIVKVVYETFEQMHNDGLIYRGNRICNWCPKHQTALSDLETKYEEREDVLYYLKYGPFTIATARPETKFGDKYVVMHPEDKRYAEYKDGQQIDLEWINGPITATVIKDSAIDMEFGTGVMTITPWHDAADFDIAQRHSLPMEQIIDKTGKLLPIAGEFAGQHIKKARPLIVEKLRAKGLLDEEKTNQHYKHNVSVCYKCGTGIEPQIIPQWYVAVTKAFRDQPSLRDIAVKAVNSGEVKITPNHFEKTYMHWMENLRDWPISRQIWWGIPIPVKYCANCSEVIVDTEDKIKSCPKCSSANLEKDPDTFDTWFSSGQWPYATLMANSGKDFQDFYPTQVMETGWDILFFWVARMIMFGYYKTGKAPFKDVFLHGLVRDKDRQKMSKSKGNVVDPLGVIDTYGTDALRFALIFSTAAGNDIPLVEEKIKGMKHFANKVWNIARYTLSAMEETALSELTPSLAEKYGALAIPNLTDADRDIISKLDLVQKEVTNNLIALRLHEAAQSIYHFIWHELADKYIEASKTQLRDAAQKENTKIILLRCLISSLKMLHPFMPFVTEEIWSNLGANNLLLIEKWGE